MQEAMALQSNQGRVSLGGSGCWRDACRVVPGTGSAGYNAAYRQPHRAGGGARGDPPESAEKTDGTATEGRYRTDPSRWTLFCQQTLGCAVELVDGYGMREFTLLARPRHEQ